MPATVTCSSAIASSSADCVFGVARLISSASSTCANTGPRAKTNSRWPSCSMSMRVPVMSAGIRSMVNWMRLKLRFSACAERAHDQRLAGARHALDQHVAAGEEGDEDLLDARRPGRRSPCPARRACGRRSRGNRRRARGRLASAPRRLGRGAGGAAERPATRLASGAAGHSAAGGGLDLRADRAGRDRSFARVKMRRTSASCSGATSAFCSGASGICSSVERGGGASGRRSRHRHRVGHVLVAAVAVRLARQRPENAVSFIARLCEGLPFGAAAGVPANSCSAVFVASRRPALAGEPGPGGLCPSPVAWLLAPRCEFASRSWPSRLWAGRVSAPIGPRRRGRTGHERPPCGAGVFAFDVISAPNAARIASWSCRRHLRRLLVVGPTCPSDAMSRPRSGGGALPLPGCRRAAPAVAGRVGRPGMRRRPPVPCLLWPGRRDRAGPARTRRRCTVRRPGGCSSAAIGRCGSAGGWAARRCSSASRAGGRNSR